MSSSCLKRGEVSCARQACTAPCMAPSAVASTAVTASGSAVDSSSEPPPDSSCFRCGAATGSTCKTRGIRVMRQGNTETLEQGEGELGKEQEEGATGRAAMAGERMEGCCGKWGPGCSGQGKDSRCGVPALLREASMAEARCLAAAAKWEY